jgi:pyridoxamine 5'-phosphate oxidase
MSRRLYGFSMDLADLRKEYAEQGIDRHQLLDDPIAQFKVWFEQARQAGVVEPNAMVLSTVDGKGAPWSRTVLLKAVESRGFSFFTNYGSHKGIHLSHEPRVALLFPWFSLERQIHINGRVIKTSELDSKTYFAKRPYGSQLGALVSNQSEIVADRKLLEARLAELKAQYPEGKVPKPANWGGYWVIPESFEFWQGRSNRLHDRFRYTMAREGWNITRLAP